MKTLFPLVACLVLPWTGLPSLSALTARVEARNGVPELIVNGVRVLPRIFYGGIGWIPMSVKAGTQTVQSEFRAVSTQAAAGLEVRFEPLPGTFILADFTLTDLDSGKQAVAADTFSDRNAFERSWAYGRLPDGSPSVRWLPSGGSQGGPAAEIVVLATAQTATNPHLHYRLGVAVTKGHHYRVSFSLKADAPQGISVILSRSDAADVNRIVGASNEPFVRQLALARKHGVSLVTFPVRLPWRPGEARPEMDTIDDLCDYILAANPDALLIPRINVNAPDAWLDSHPGQEMVWEGTRNRNNRMATVASLTYRREVQALLARLVDHLERKYGEHMAGYHVAGQNSNEWFYEDSHNSALNGYSPADLELWRTWLASRYPTDAELRRAWHRDTVTRATAEVPPPAARRAAPAGTFRDLASERPIVDWNEFQQEIMADTVCDLARTVRQSTGGRKLVLFFYGYLFEFADLPMGPGNSGHYALRRVLESPDVDVLCAPISYVDRGSAGTAPSMTASESVALAGKLWLMEDDTSTHLTLAYVHPPGSEFRSQSIQEDCEVLLRNDAECDLRNMGTWWMDLARNGWFADPVMWTSHEKLKDLESFMLRSEHPFRPEIAAVVDERSMLLLTPLHQASGHLLSFGRGALGRVGAPYGQYLQDDVLRGRVPDPKLYVFLDPWRLEGAERRDLVARTRGKVRLWGYGSGWMEGESRSLKAVEELTGFRVALAKAATPTLTPTDLGKRLGLSPSLPGYEGRRLANPLFAIDDAGPGEVLAQFADGSAAVACRKSPDGVSIFCGVPILTPELLRIAARMAGVHLYVDGNAAVYANGPFVAIHGTDDVDLLKVDTGRAGAIRDLLTGQMIGAGPKCELAVPKGITRVLEVISE